MKIQWIGLLALLIPGLLWAEQDSEEYRLLKSWGLKFNGDGVLQFRKPVSRNLSHSPWLPDLSVYETQQTGASKQQVILPLIISSRNKEK